MNLILYNTLTRSNEIFHPLEEDHVRFYVCGPTVHDFAHLGNARAVIVFDLLNRLLRTLYSRVTYVRNITDIDDKILTAALDQGNTPSHIAQKFEKAFHHDMAALGAHPPDISPRATEHIPDMIAMISTLLERGHAYKNAGHVLFSISTVASYGQLSRRDSIACRAGARIEVADYKRDPADFVLWKPARQDEPGWASPFGRGRPGWHIECSAMADRYLGHQFDIHGGGEDLIFPHHENEIVQSSCARDGYLPARFWVHNGHVTVSGEKMSKSVGNVLTIRELLTQFSGESIRYFLLSTHYRAPIDVTYERLLNATRALDRIYAALRSYEYLSPVSSPDNDHNPDFLSALHDDLNTPRALASLHQCVNRLNGSSDKVMKQHFKSQILIAGAQLGFDFQHNIADQHMLSQQGDDQWIEERIAERSAARYRKDFERADAIRCALAAAGIIVEDRPHRTGWYRKPLKQREESKA